MNIRLRPSRSTFLVSGLLLALMAVPCRLMWDVWRQAKVEVLEGRQ